MSIIILIFILIISYILCNMLFKLPLKGGQFNNNYEKLKCSIKPNKVLQQIIPYVDLNLLADDESNLRIIKWNKDLIIPISYNCLDSDIIIVTDIPENETVKYALIDEDFKITTNPAFNNVIFIYKTGKIKIIRLFKPVNINIFDVPLYRCSKMAKTLIETKDYLNGLIKLFISTGNINSSEVLEFKKNLKLINEELRYYKENYPEYIM